MRILCTEADLLFIRKSAKLFCKFSPVHYKHTAAMEKFAVWMGFFDYKQLKRNVVESPVTLPAEHLDALEQGITSELISNHLADDKAKSLTSSLNLGKLSAFSYRPSNLPAMAPHQSNVEESAENTSTRRMVVDELFMTIDAFKDTNNGADSVLQALDIVGMERAEWFIPYGCKDIHEPSVVILERLMPLIKALLEEDQRFNEQAPHRWDEFTQDNFKSEVQKLWPQVMVSAYEAVSDEKHAISPFGFTLVQGRSLDGSETVYGAYNDAIHVCLPNFWDNRESALEVLAYLLIGLVVNKTSGSLNGAFEFDDTWTMVLRNSKAVETAHHLEELGFSVCATTNLNIDLPSYDDSILTLHTKASAEPAKVFHERSLSNHATWISVEKLAAVNNTADQFELAVAKAMATLSDGKDVSQLAALIKDQVNEQYSPYINDEGEHCFDIDNVEWFKDAFPGLAPAFDDRVIDSWHVDCSTYTGFPRKTSGQICSSQGEMLGYVLYEVLTGKPCKHEHDTQLAAIVAAKYIDNPELTLRDLMRLHDQIRTLHKAIAKVLTTLWTIWRGLQTAGANKVGGVGHKVRTSAELFAQARGLGAIKYSETI